MAILMWNFCMNYVFVSSRGFGFITYSAAEMLEEALATRPHVIDAKEVEPKRAMPREVIMLYFNHF